MAAIRHVRVVFTGGLLDSISLGEWELWGNPPGGPGATNQLLAQPATASSTFADAAYDPDHAVDGSQTTYWSSDINDVVGAWLAVPPIATTLEVIDSYRLRIDDNSVDQLFAPTGWTLEATDDPAGATGWVVLDTQSGQTFTDGAWNSHTGPWSLPGTDITLTAPAVRLGLRPGVPTLTSLPLALVAPGARIGLRSGVPVVTLALTAPAARLGLRPGVPTLTGLDLDLVVPAVRLGLRGPRPTLRYSLFSPTETTIYRAYVDQAGDRVEVPVSSIQTRLREVGVSFVVITVPDGLSYVDAIRARSAGDLILMRGVRTSEGVEVLNELVRAPLTGITVDAGGRSSTITLIARDEIPVTAPQRLDLEQVQSYTDRDGTLTVRASVNDRLRPGDTAVFGGGEFAVETVLILESTRGLSRMEVTG